MTSSLLTAACWKENGFNNGHLWHFRQHLPWDKLIHPPDTFDFLAYNLEKKVFNEVFVTHLERSANWLADKCGHVELWSLPSHQQERKKSRLKCCAVSVVCTRVWSENLACSVGFHCRIVPTKQNCLLPCENLENTMVEGMFMCLDSKWLATRPGLSSATFAVFLMWMVFF